MEQTYPDIKDLLTVLNNLGNEVDICQGLIDAEMEESEVVLCRRMYIRAAFGFMEAGIYCIKQLTYGSSGRPDVEFSRAEGILLLDESYALDSKGEAVTSPFGMSLMENLRFAVKAFARAHYSGFELAEDDEGWAKLRRSIEIKDRLMHPKNGDDLFVSEEEVNVVIEATDWFVARSQELQDSSLEGLKKKKAEILAEQQAEEQDGEDTEPVM